MVLAGSYGLRAIHRHRADGYDRYRRRRGACAFADRPLEVKATMVLAGSYGPRAIHRHRADGYDRASIGTGPMATTGHLSVQGRWLRTEVARQLQLRSVWPSGQFGQVLPGVLIHPAKCFVQGVDISLHLANALPLIGGRPRHMLIAEIDRFLQRHSERDFSSLCPAMAGAKPRRAAECGGQIASLRAEHVKQDTGRRLTLFR